MNCRILEVGFDFEFFRSGFWVRNQDTERQELAGFVKKVFIVSIDACQSPKKSINSHVEMKDLEFIIFILRK